MTIQEFISGVTVNITTKTQRNSITPGIVGGAFVNLANIVAALPTGSTIPTGGTTGGTISFTQITDDVDDFFGAKFVNDGFNSFNYLDSGNTLNEVPVGSTYVADLTTEGTHPALRLLSYKMYAMFPKTVADTFTKSDIVNDFNGSTGTAFIYPGGQLSILLNQILTKESLPSLEQSFTEGYFHFIDVDTTIIGYNSNPNTPNVATLQILDVNDNVVYDAANDGRINQRGNFLGDNTVQYKINVQYVGGQNGTASISYNNFDGTQGSASLTGDFNNGGFYSPISISISVGSA